MGRLKSTVLVIEAQALSRFLIRHELEKRGFQVLSARSKIEAADLLADRRAPDIVVLGDMSADRRSAYRVVRLPNARARGPAARLSGHSSSPELPRPLTAAAVAEVVLSLVNDSPKVEPAWARPESLLGPRSLGEEPAAA